MSPASAVCNSRSIRSNTLDIWRIQCCRYSRAASAFARRSSPHSTPETTCAQTHLSMARVRAQVKERKEGQLVVTYCRESSEGDWTWLARTIIKVKIEPTPRPETRTSRNNHSIVLYLNFRVCFEVGRRRRRRRPISCSPFFRPVFILHFTFLYRDRACPHSRCRCSTLIASRGLFRTGERVGARDGSTSCSRTARATRACPCLSPAPAQHSDLRDTP